MDWVWWATDLLASEYGWAKNDILYDTYLDEVYSLVEKINKRKLSEYKIALAIAQNPHVKDPNVLWKELEKQETDFSIKPEKKQEFDAVGFEALKSAMSSNPRIIVK